VLGLAPLLSSARRSLGARVAVGLLLGALYAAADAYLDARIEAGAVLSSALVVGHHIVDLILPLVTGALLGVSTHVLHVRAEVAQTERRRADELHARVHNIKRDQAVWVVAASLLHNLRTPLHALGLLLDEASALGESAGAERAALLERARLQADRLIEQVGALRSLPASQQPELPDIDLFEVSRRAVGDLQGLVRGAPLRLSARGEPGTTARASAAYVEIILENLVENSLTSLRARGGPGAVEVEVAVEDDRAVVRVRDDGPGIDPDDVAALFEPLQGSTTGGLGLGLSIARALARSMSGDLRLEHGQPPTFRLELPRSP
jgi:signal transduction histidine kinase